MKKNNLSTFIKFFLFSFVFIFSFNVGLACKNNCLKLGWAKNDTAAVAFLQSELNRLVFLPFEGSGAPKTVGIFDKNTEAALKQFQRSVGITPDGILGKETSYSLWQSQNPGRNQTLPDAEAKEMQKKMDETRDQLSNYLGEYYQKPIAPDNQVVDGDIPKSAETIFPKPEAPVGPIEQPPVEQPISAIEPDLPKAPQFFPPEKSDALQRAAWATEEFLTGKIPEDKLRTMTPEQLDESLAYYKEKPFKDSLEGCIYWCANYEDAEKNIKNIENEKLRRQVPENTAQKNEPVPAEELSYLKNREREQKNTESVLMENPELGGEIKPGSVRKEFDYVCDESGRNCAPIPEENKFQVFERCGIKDKSKCVFVVTNIKDDRPEKGRTVIKPGEEVELCKLNPNMCKYLYVRKGLVVDDPQKPGTKKFDYTKMQPNERGVFRYVPEARTLAEQDAADPKYVLP